MSTVAVVIPAYNEATTVGSVVGSIPKTIAGTPVTVIVVDDGSRDNTATLAKQAGAVVLRHRWNKGAGAAIVTGLTAACKTYTAVAVVTMDADGQHSADDLPALVVPVLKGQYDVTIGDRIGDHTMPPVRRWANLLLSVFTRAAYGAWIRDSQSGYKCFSREALQCIQLTTTGHNICSEMVGEITRCKLSYASVPVKAIYTDYSLSKGQGAWAGIKLLVHLTAVTIDHYVDRYNARRA